MQLEICDLDRRLAVITRYISVSDTIDCQPIVSKWRLIGYVCEHRGAGGPGPDVRFIRQNSPRSRRVAPQHQKVPGTSSVPVGIVLSGADTERIENNRQWVVDLDPVPEIICSVCKSSSSCASIEPGCDIVGQIRMPKGVEPIIKRHVRDHGIISEQGRSGCHVVAVPVFRICDINSVPSQGGRWIFLSRSDRDGCSVVCQELDLFKVSSRTIT